MTDTVKRLSEEIHRRERVSRIYRWRLRRVAWWVLFWRSGARGGSVAALVLLSRSIIHCFVTVVRRHSVRRSISSRKSMTCLPGMSKARSTSVPAPFRSVMVPISIDLKSFT